MRRGGAIPLRRFADWPLRTKILVPFALLSLLYGASGTYIFAKGTAAEQRANRSGRLRDAAALAIDRMSESEFALSGLARRIAFTEGVSGAAAGGDTRALRRFVVPLAANSTTSFAAVVDARGRTLLDVSGGPGTPRPLGGASWGARPVVRRIAATARGHAADLGAGFASRGATAYLVVAAPITDERGVTVGAAVVGDELAGLLAQAGRLTPATLSLVGRSGQRLAGAPLAIPIRAPLRRLEDRGAGILVTPITIRGEKVGAIAVALPTPSGLGVLGGEAWKIAFLAIASLAGVFLVGAWVARGMAGPVRKLVDATRALARGDLSHRARIRQADEVGELASSVNTMADELEASHRNLERRVEERTTQLSGALADLDRTNTSLARANEAKSAFLANVSHELRTPLSGILMASEMLHDPSFGALPERRARDLGTKINRAGRHLLALIDDLLDLSKIEAGHLELRPEPVGLGDLLAEVHSAIEPIAGGRGVSLQAPPASSHSVQADPVRVRQVLFNLLTNAVKFTPSGGRVWLEVARSKAGIAISVRDTGVGIESKDLERIFQPFEQVSGEPREGAGLGLAISRRIVELHGGRLAVTSARGKGSTFTLTLPPATAPVAAARVPDHGSAEPASGSPSRILVVEDDLPTRELVTGVLRSSGYVVDEAGTVGDARESVGRDAPDLVLLDIRLGAEDGLDVVRWVRADPRLRDLKVVALSAHALQHEIERGITAGCDAFLVKPIGGRALLQRVHALLQDGRARAGAAPAAAEGRAPSSRANGARAPRRATAAGRR